VSSEKDRPPRGSRLALAAGQIGSVYTVRLSGEFDLDGCERVQQALRDGDKSTAKRILLDLDRLIFIDSSGLQTILAAARRADRDGGRLRMTRGTGEVAKVFRLTALDLVLPFDDA
jgi:stage II sporulation protein AA (anti-sigma F factor antagonist)